MLEPLQAYVKIVQDIALWSKSARKEGLDFLGEILDQFSKNKLAQSSVLYSTMLENISSKKENVEIEAGYPFESKKISSSLQDSAEIERYEGENLFSYFSKIAKDEGFDNLASVFNSISKINLEWASMLSNLAQKHSLKALYTSEQEVKWTCFNCGNFTLSKKAWSSCPLCGANKGHVIFQI